MPMLRRVLLLGLVSLFAMAAPATAQRYDDRYGGRQQSSAPGDFDYYVLVLSWSPTYCAGLDSADRDPHQCSRRDGRRYAFVLHGLWPQYERGYPEFCRTRRRPYVPQPLIDGMLDIMPSPKLVIHEYRKHGTCSGLDPQSYYDLARRLYRTINIPERYINPFEAQFVSPGDLADEFLSANPHLKPDRIAVSCGGAGNRLREVRICFTRDGQVRGCGHNENPGRLCRADRMYVPPVRSSTAPDRQDDRDSGAGAAPPPRPRVIPSPREY